jgi:hypothetical protein
VTIDATRVVSVESSGPIAPRSNTGVAAELAVDIAMATAATIAAGAATARNCFMVVSLAALSAAMG